MLKLRKRVTRWILLIFWMCFIFFMSSMTGSESSAQSGLVIKLIKLLGININESTSEIISFVVRKLAHFTEYMILFVLIYRVASLYFKSRKTLLLCLLLVFLYASSDEFHQSFIPGRSPAFRDVMIDTSGGFFAWVVLYFKQGRS